jgi:hypothetical protein
MLGKGGESECDRGLLASLWLCISNDLYGSSNKLAHSLELGFNIAIKVTCHHHNVCGTCVEQRKNLTLKQGLIVNTQQTFRYSTQTRSLTGRKQEC